jgi:hypothetical protein
MTLQNLSRILDKYEQLGSTDRQQFEVINGLPFYDWSAADSSTTFNHAIGLPRKNDVPCPLHDYEQLLMIHYNNTGDRADN